MLEPRLPSFWFDLFQSCSIETIDWNLHRRPRFIVRTGGRRHEGLELLINTWESERIGQMLPESGEMDLRTARGRIEFARLFNPWEGNEEKLLMTFPWQSSHERFIWLRKLKNEA